MNHLNAQNINCRALSENLDREKFEIGTMLFPIQNAQDFKRLEDVEYFQLKRPVRLNIYWNYLKALLWADMAFLPKGEIDNWNLFLAKLFNVKVFTTVEGLIDDYNLNIVFNNKEKKNKYITHFKKYEPNLYAITHHIKKDVGNRHGYKFADKVLYLGVNSDNFKVNRSQRNGLRDIVLIGNTPKSKNIPDFFEMAKRFPDLNFHYVGGNEYEGRTLEEVIEEKGLSNITYHGRLDHSQLSKLLSEMDLMYFPSRSEGFPKVHLETACAGVPTLCYNDYGAEEWITNWKNGIVVKNVDEAADAIKKLQDNPQLLKKMSLEAVKLSESFDWKNLIKDWEEVILQIVKS